MKRNFLHIFILFSICLFCSCISLVEKAGRLLDGSNEKIIESYSTEQSNVTIHKVTNRNNGESLIITFEKYPEIKIRASIPAEDGTLYFTSLEYLAGNAQGWNEFYLDLLGSARFETQQNFTLSIIEKIEPVQISDGRIHRRDTRLTGDEAVTALRNRHQRILALTEWMLSLEDAQKCNNLSEFEDYWKPIILPELVSRDKRPQDWEMETDKFARAENIRWNTSYTERVFPEQLHLVRNSGTLLRDWEEASAWIYIEYEWDNIVELLHSQLIFQKIK